MKKRVYYGKIFISLLIPCGLVGLMKYGDAHQKPAKNMIRKTEIKAVEEKMTPYIFSDKVQIDRKLMMRKTFINKLLESLREEPF